MVHPGPHDGVFALGFGFRDCGSNNGDYVPWKCGTADCEGTVSICHQASDQSRLT